MKVSWVPTTRCAENCASFCIFATDWIPVTESRRSYSDQEQSSWKCLQLRYSTNTGLRLHTLRPLLKLPVAISLLLIQTVQLFSYIPRLYSTDLQRHPLHLLTANEIFEILFHLFQQCPWHKLYVHTLLIILRFRNQPVKCLQRYLTKWTRLEPLSNKLLVTEMITARTAQVPDSRPTWRLNSAL
jgi:hypothetical protein